MRKDQLLAARRRLRTEWRDILDGDVDYNLTDTEQARCRAIRGRLDVIKGELSGKPVTAPPRTPPTRSRRIQELHEELDRMAGEPGEHQHTSQRSWRGAFHEAGHAVVFAVRGALPTEVTFRETRVEDPYDPVGLLAGAEAARLAGFADASSASDEALLVEAWRRRGQTQRWRGGQEAEARNVLVGYWPAVHAVAHGLMHKQRLTGNEVGRLIHAGMRRGRPRMVPVSYGRQCLIGA